MDWTWVFEREKELRKMENQGNKGKKEVSGRKELCVEVGGGTCTWRMKGKEGRRAGLAQGGASGYVGTTVMACSELPALTLFHKHP